MEIKIEIDENELKEIVIKNIAEKFVGNALRTGTISLDSKYAARMIRRQIYDTVQKFFADNKDILTEMVTKATGKYLESSANTKNGRLRKMIEQLLKEEEE